MKMSFLLLAILSIFSKSMCQEHHHSWPKHDMPKPTFYEPNFDELTPEEQRELEQRKHERDAQRKRLDDQKRKFKEWKQNHKPHRHEGYDGYLPHDTTKNFK